MDTDAKHPQAAEARLPDSDVAEPVVERSSRFSLVWLLPIAAAGIGIWLVIVGIHEKGPSITVGFETAEGLEAGKTKVKYREVEVGLLKSLQISADRRSVVATLDIAKSASQYLTETTSFWVVRPRLDASGISGLGTLISGAYIELEPGAAGHRLNHYTALETPPVVRIDAPGRRYVLRSSSAESLEARTPIFYRGVRVGQILGYELSSDGAFVDCYMFVKAPFDKIVTEDSHFWLRHGVEVDAGTDGFKIKIGSLAVLLAGGIEFDAPGGEAASAAENHVFALYDSKEAIGEAAIVEKIPYVLYFEDSVRGLAVGGPVELHGIRVGTVSAIRPEIDLLNNSVRIAVRVELEPERFKGVSDLRGEADFKQYALMSALVAKGLRARLETASLLTGQKLVSLDFFPDEPTKSLDVTQAVPEIPTLPGSFDQITTTMERILRRVDSLPIDVLVGQVQDAVVSLDLTLQDTRTLMQSGDRNLEPLVKDFRAAASAARDALQEAQRTTGSLENSLGESSEVRMRLALMLREFTETSRTIRELADYVERNPESLLRGKRETSQ